MKYVFTVLLFVVMTLSLNTQANVDPANEYLAKMIISGDDRKLKTAAKDIKSTKVTDPALMDMLAEVLMVRYEGAFPSEVDTLAWVARAIGSSQNARYRDILSEVSGATEHKKLRRHAKSALGDLNKVEVEQYTKGAYVLPAGLYARESDSVRDKRIMKLITAGDLRNLKDGARTIVDTKAQNVELTDALAEILLIHHANAADSKIDTLSWTATALGSSMSGRYVDVLTEVEINGSHKKLRKYAKRALKNHGPASETQYQKGMYTGQLGAYNF